VTPGALAPPSRPPPESATAAFPDCRTRHGPQDSRPCADTLLWHFRPAAAATRHRLILRQNRGLASTAVSSF
jgi:hypothetical protein